MQKHILQKGNFQPKRQYISGNVELWLKDTFPKVIFRNNISYSICCKKDLDGLSEDSTYVFQREMLDRYKPDTNFQIGKYVEIDSLSFAEFLAYNCVASKPKEESEDESQPAVLDDELMESCHSDSYHNKTVPLFVIKGKVKMQKSKGSFTISCTKCKQKYRKLCTQLAFFILPI